MKTQTFCTSKRAALMLFLLLSQSAISETIVDRGDVQSQEHVYQVLDKDILSIRFAQGSSALSDSDMANISAFVKATYNESKVERYLVAAWSDKDYPENGDLSRGQRRLAAARGKHIESALNAASAGKVDRFEMTKQPNWIQRAFSTETAEIQNKGANFTLNQRLFKEIGTKLHDKGGPQMAVIVAKFKDAVSIN